MGDDQCEAVDPATERRLCDHICLKDYGHVERGEPHFYGYEHPSPRAHLTLGDDLQERIARALADAYRPDDTQWWWTCADAVLAVLPQCEQVGWDEAVLALNRGVPVYIVREDNDE